MASQIAVVARGSPSHSLRLVHMTPLTVSEGLGLKAFATQDFLQGRGIKGFRRLGVGTRGARMTGNGSFLPSSTTGFTLPDTKWTCGGRGSRT